MLCGVSNGLPDIPDELTNVAPDEVANTHTDSRADAPDQLTNDRTDSFPHGVYTERGAHVVVRNYIQCKLQFNYDADDFTCGIAASMRQFQQSSPEL